MAISHLERMEHIQAELRDYKERHRLSFRELAEKTGLSKAEIWQLMNDSRANPRYRTINQIEQSLGIRLHLGIDAESDDSVINRRKLTAIHQIIESRD